MRPGKPFWGGALGDGRVVLGLPGNPVAALAALELFALPLIRAWQGENSIERISLPCRPAPLNPGKLEKLTFARLHIDAGGRIWAEPLGGDDSAAHMPIASADLLLRIAPESVGDDVQAIRL
jgi:molybdopterin molybdotransferase